MILAHKMRLYPTPQQEVQFWRSSGTARFIYNWTLAQQEAHFEKCRIANEKTSFLSDNVLRKEITVLKKDENALAWLSKVSNNVAKQAVKDACLAYKRFFSKQAGRPKFKSRKNARPAFYNDSFTFQVQHGAVKIEKIGWVRIKEAALVAEKYTNPRITHDGKYWYISYGTEVSNENVELTGVSLGIDLGLKDFAVCSDNVVYKNINKTKVVRKIEKKLRRLQRQVSRKYEMNKVGKKFVKTNNIKKLEREIRLIHRRLANIRKNYLHQTTTQIVKTKPSRIVLETLNVKGMMKNKHLAQAISKQGFYEFKRQIAYKCERFGIEFVEANPWFPSSKMCSHCGTVKKEFKLSERTYHCDNCLKAIDRDYNAAINLSRYTTRA